MPSISLLRTLGRLVIRRNGNNSLKNISGVCFITTNSTYRAHNIYPQNLHLHKRMMGSAIAVTNIGLKELKTYQNNKSATIIDVRELDEIKETGLLPGGINIPLGDVYKALQEDPNTFEKKYKHPKPMKNSPIVFSCRSGKRSLKAAQSAESLGFTNVFNFEGGWIEWENNLSK